jgi:hypothetical protein
MSCFFVLGDAIFFGFHVGIQEIGTKSKAADEVFTLDISKKKKVRLQMRGYARHF